MTSRHARIFASPLANALALDVAALAALALLESAPATSAVLSDEISGRVPGLALVGVAWFTLRTALRISIGLRRALAFSSGLVTLIVGVLHGVGPSVRTLIELRLGAWASGPTREVISAVMVSLATVFVWRTSPALRR